MEHLIQRQQVLQEVFDTELLYLKTLGELQHNYLEPCLARYPELQREIDTVFVNMPELCEVHKEILELLKDTVKLGPQKSRLGERVGAVYLEFAARLSVYETFVSGWDESQRLILRWEGENSKLWRLVEEQRRLTGAMPLGALLIQPIQRLCRYPLMLDQLVSLTPRDHPDRTALEEAHRAATACVGRVDQAKASCSERAKSRSLLSRAEDLPAALLPAWRPAFVVAETPCHLGDAGVGVVVLLENALILFSQKKASSPLVYQCHFDICEALALPLPSGDLRLLSIWEVSCSLGSVFFSDSFQSVCGVTFTPLRAPMCYF